MLYQKNKKRADLLSILKLVDEALTVSLNSNWQNLDNQDRMDIKQDVLLNLSLGAILTIEKPNSSWYFVQRMAFFRASKRWKEIKRDRDAQKYIRDDSEEDSFFSLESTVSKPDASVGQQELRERIYIVLCKMKKELPTNYPAFWKRFFEGKSDEEISMEFNISEATSRKRVQRGRVWFVKNFFRITKTGKQVPSTSMAVTMGRMKLEQKTIYSAFRAFYDGDSYKKISKDLGISKDRVEKYVSQGRKWFEENLFLSQIQRKKTLK